MGETIKQETTEIIYWIQDKLRNECPHIQGAKIIHLEVFDYDTQYREHSCFNVAESTQKITSEEK